MNTGNILLTNIQRFSLHDGPGIRTTVFLKGCSLRCPWCSNPENLEPLPQEYVKDGIPGVYGKYYSAAELVKECLKDKNFYEGKINDPVLWNISSSSDIDDLPGGVTFSGGESLLQMNALVPVCEELSNEGIHIAVETCLFVPEYNVGLAIEHIDFFYIDMKILEKTRCKAFEHGNLGLYLRNLGTVVESGKPIVVRVPVIGTYTDTNENRKSVYDLLEKYRNRVIKIELIREHNLGKSKYKSLGMSMDFHGVSDEMMEKYKNELLDLGIPIEVCKI